MHINIHDPSGWLVGGDRTHTHDISSDDLYQLLELGREDDQWAYNVQSEIDYYDENPRYDQSSILVDYMRVLNARGSIVPFPYGYVCTIPSRRHLFRGENSDFEFSESSLSRRCRKVQHSKRKLIPIELLHIVSNMRIAQFCKFIWQFDIIPQWEGKLCEVNYKALAQHYGFDTFLLDLTNDIRAALFFATCKFVDDHYEPLSNEDIKRSGRSLYGVIYHAPDWWMDFINGAGLKLEMAFAREEGEKSPYIIDNGLNDGVAFQIGLQPFYRCHAQCGYVYPMKTLRDIRHNGAFERLRFRHSAEFSKDIYHLMGDGSKVFPDEGISMAAMILDQIRNSLVFSEDDMISVYEDDGVNKTIFPTIESVRSALQSDETAHLIEKAYGVKDGHIHIVENEVEYPLSNSLKSIINSKYNDKSFIEPVGEKIYISPEAQQFREQRYHEIFG